MQIQIIQDIRKKLGNWIYTYTDGSFNLQSYTTEF